MAGDLLSPRLGLGSWSTGFSPTLVGAVKRESCACASLCELRVQRVRREQRAQRDFLGFS